MARIGDPSSPFSRVPSTLHGQLFLLAFDARSGRFGGFDPQLFGFALRAAMLTDLHLRGFLVERAGKPVPARAASPDDPILRAEFAQVGVHNRATWAQLVVGNQHEVITAVQEQLVNEGWLRTRQRPGLPVSDAGLEPFDQCRVRGLADAARGALSNALDGLPAEPRPLACGLLAAAAELPVMGEFSADVRGWVRLDGVAAGDLVPVSGLIEAIRDHRGGGRPGLMGGSS
ncbi:GOLPH3/VPS74 family protein [Mycolicibacterium sp. ELW1]|uniref:GOLPH3/VPS74 family protein n=1 Tax=Mycobacteriaceae TaxID=1762 RepID=UPI00143D9022|nr:GPP34 family phosphoprotein [Mycobacterium sp. ELW1]